MEEKIVKDMTQTTIRVSRADVKLSQQIMADLGCSSQRELYHRFVTNYYIVTLLGDEKENEK